MTKNSAPESGPVLEEIVRAAALCVARDGFDAMTMDDIVRESGVPRTTVYRRVGGREAVLRALLNAMTLDRIQLCQSIAMGPGVLPERLARVIASNIASIAGIPWLHAMLQRGISQELLALLSSTNMELSRRVLRPMLEAAASSGAWTPPTAIDALLDWVVRQTLMMGGEDRLDETEMLERVRIFVIPAFRFDREVEAMRKAETEPLARLG